tara:strand:- start:429 stop:1106 length:678 start_codon:yes stop_codon:yes gene_type:complete
MNIKTTLPVIWLPLVALWTFLIVLQGNLDTNSLESVIPLFSYFIVSFLLLLQLQLVLINKKEGYLVKFGTANIIFLSLSLSSLFIFISFLQLLPNSLATGLIILPLISNTVIAELMSFSNEKIVNKKNAWTKTNKLLEERQIKSSKENSSERNIYLKNRQEWELYLEDSLIVYLNNNDICNEINRIKEIIKFSSFFRSQDSLRRLAQLHDSKEDNEIIEILKSIK